MGIVILNAREYSTKLKVTIQSTGKLGFTGETTNALGITEETYIAFGVDEEDSNTMYLVITEQSDNSFKVRKSGAYYYLPTTNLFLSLGLDFKHNTIMFDLSRAVELDKELNGTVYQMHCRIKTKRNMV